jgi:hypothetical protein
MYIDMESFMMGVLFGGVCTLVVVLVVVLIVLFKKKWFATKTPPIMK